MSSFLEPLFDLCSDVEASKMERRDRSAAIFSYNVFFFQDSYLLSAQECITAGSFQNKYRNVTNFCTDGHFGSKFVTLVASGQFLFRSFYSIILVCLFLLLSFIISKNQLLSSFGR